MLSFQTAKGATEEYMNMGVVNGRHVMYSRFSEVVWVIWLMECQYHSHSFNWFFISSLHLIKVNKICIKKLWGTIGGRRKGSRFTATSLEGSVECLKPLVQQDCNHITCNTSRYNGWNWFFEATVLFSAVFIITVTLLLLSWLILHLIRLIHKQMFEIFPWSLWSHLFLCKDIISWRCWGTKWVLSVLHNSPPRRGCFLG